jgi:iron complex outermembrane receptor protein
LRKEGKVSSANQGFRGEPASDGRGRLLRRRRRSGELEPALLEAARDVFSEKGYARATTREIAARAAIAEALLFRKFGSKARLFAQVVLQPMEEFIRKTTEQFSELVGAGPPELAQRRFIDELYSISCEQRGLMLTFFATSVFEPEVLEAHGTIASAQRGLDELARLTEQRLRDLGIDPGFDVRLTSRSVIGMVIAMALFGDWLLPNGRRKPTRAALVDEMTRQVLYGGFNQRPKLPLPSRQRAQAGRLTEGDDSVVRRGRNKLSKVRVPKIAIILFASLMLVRSVAAQEQQQEQPVDQQIAASERTQAGPPAQKQNAPAAANQATTAPKAQSKPAAAEGQPGGNVEEIVVTAQKRAQNLQDIPVSMTAIGGGDVTFRQITNLKDLQYDVPGLTYGEREGGASVTIRGVGVNVNFGPFESGVATHIDGVYQPTITSGVLGLNDLERVEVLRGPQGTIYGRNATGGAINFILKKPTDELEGLVRVGYGSYDSKNVFAMVSGPLIKGLLDARVYGEYDDADGFVKNLTLHRMIGGHEGYGHRVAFRFMPLENLTDDLSIVTRSDHLAPVEVMVTPPNPVLEAMLSIVPSTSADYVLGDRYKVKENRHGVGHKETYNLANTVAWDTEYATVKSITGGQYHYLQFDYENDAEDKSTFHLKPNRERSVTVSQEFNVSHSLALPYRTKLDWLVGAFYFNQTYDTLIDVDIPDSIVPGGIAVFAKTAENVSAYAGFADATYSLTHWLRLFAGLRQSFEDKNLLQSLQAVAGPNRTVIPPIPMIIEDQLHVHLCKDVHLKTSFNNISPRYGAQVDATDSVMFYAQQALGFKAGGANPFACNNIFKPEDVDSKEVGVKSRWFEGLLTANFSLFTNDYTNFQVAKTTGLEGPVVNAKKAQIYGAELELHSRPLAEISSRLAPFSVDVLVSWLHARYKNFTDLDPANPGPPGMPFMQDLAGRHMNRAPDYTLNIGTEYQWPIPVSGLGLFRARSEWFFTDKVYFRPYQLAHDDGQNAYSLWNVYLSVANARDNLEFRLFGKNILNTEYLVNISATQIGTHYGEPGAPFTIGGEIQARF